MRLDKFLCEMNIGTRSQVKAYVKQGLVTVNGTIVRAGDLKIAENSDVVTFRGEHLHYRKFHYYMLNKPKGVVSATEDNVSKTVLELLPKELRKNIFPVGRLDKDTEGLLLLTDDGGLAHELLSPKKHINKTYLVDTEAPLSEKEIVSLEQGVDIGEEKPTLPAKVEVVRERQILLTIQEGKFHQVKRMLQSVGNGVRNLKRVSFGAVTLDEDLTPGSFRELTETEIAVLQKAETAHTQNTKQKMMQGKEAVIFDLDGSLVDSMWMWKQIDVEYLGRFGISLPEKLQENIGGMSFHETALYFKENFPIPDSIEQMKKDWNQMAWDKYLNEVPFKPGAEEFLKGCKKRGIKLGIATSNSRELVENIASVHGLHDFFSCIITGSEVTHGKPAPDIYLAVAKELNVSPEKCLVFEDITPGIRAGLNAGMEVCAVEDAHSVPEREAKKALAQYYIEDFYGIFEE